MSEQLSAVARALSSEEDGAQLTMDKALSMAVEMIDGCDEAAVVLVDKRKGIETVASTSDAGVLGDKLQVQLQEGPCLDAAWEHEIVSSPNLAADPRWPAWGPMAAAELGMRSMLCFQLFVADDSLGALDMFSQEPHGFTDEDHINGQALAAQVAAALVAARTIDQLNVAVDHRTIIGEAKGIMMERFDIDSYAAFAVLRRVSSHSNRKLHDVAAELVRTRKTPGASTALDEQ